MLLCRRPTGLQAPHWPCGLLGPLPTTRARLAHDALPPAPIRACLAPMHARQECEGASCCRGAPHCCCSSTGRSSRPHRTHTHTPLLPSHAQLGQAHFLRGCGLAGEWQLVGGRSYSSARVHSLGRAAPQATQHACALLVSPLSPTHAPHLAGPLWALQRVGDGGHVSRAQPCHR